MIRKTAVTKGALQRRVQKLSKGKMRIILSLEIYPVEIKENFKMCYIYGTGTKQTILPRAYNSLAVTRQPEMDEREFNVTFA